MTRLLLESVKPPSVVQEVDGVPVTEQMGMYISLEPGPFGCLPDDLAGSLLGYVPALARALGGAVEWKHVICNPP